MDQSPNICPTKMPTIARLFNIARETKRISLVRALQYEDLANLHFYGDLLDIGGGNKADYRKMLKCSSYASVNISAKMEPTWVVQVGDQFPIDDLSFDSVLSLNTFEHVYETDHLLFEISRVLKPSGVFIAATPFLFRVHGSPEDYFRPTASWWIRTLQRHGFDDIQVTPSLWGPFSNGLFCSGSPGFGKRVRLLSSMVLDLIYAKLKFGKGIDGGISNVDFQNSPLTYFVRAKKM